MSRPQTCKAQRKKHDPAGIQTLVWCKDKFATYSTLQRSLREYFYTRKVDSNILHVRPCDSKNLTK